MRQRTLSNSLLPHRELCGDQELHAAPSRTGAVLEGRVEIIELRVVPLTRLYSNLELPVSDISVHDDGI
jgi:hypothetical protein